MFGSELISLTLALSQGERGRNVGAAFGRERAAGNLFAAKGRSYSCLAFMKSTTWGRDDQFID